MQAFVQNQKLYDEHFCYFQNLLRKNEMENTAPETLKKNVFANSEAYETLLKVTPGIIMIVDYSRHNYLYHSDNIHQLDIDLNLVYEQGTAYTFSLFHPQHYTIMRNEIFPEVYRLLGEYCQKGDAQKLRIVFCNLTRTASGEYQWYMHHISILSTHQSEPVVGLKYMVNIHPFKKDNSVDLHAYYINDDQTETSIFKKSVSTVSANLSERERQIMDLIAQGKTSKQIAYELNISIHTVNTHRRNMLSKTNSANSTELISSNQ